MAACGDNPVYLRLHSIKVYRVKMWGFHSTQPVLTSPNGAFPVTAPLTTHLFSRPQSPDALETRVRQLHDWRNSRTAVRRHHVRVQHRGGQHGEETARGLFSPGPQSNPLHHHLLSKVLYTRFTSLQCTYIYFHFPLYLKIILTNVHVLVDIAGWVVQVLPSQSIDQVPLIVEWPSRSFSQMKPSTNTQDSGSYQKSTHI